MLYQIMTKLNVTPHDIYEQQRGKYSGTEK